jgi:hypothetical protein
MSGPMSDADRLRAIRKRARVWSHDWRDWNVSTDGDGLFVEGVPDGKGVPAVLLRATREGGFEATEQAAAAPSDCVFLLGLVDRAAEKVRDLTRDLSQVRADLARATADIAAFDDAISAAVGNGEATRAISGKPKAGRPSASQASARGASGAAQDERSEKNRTAGAPAHPRNQTGKDYSAQAAMLCDGSVSFRRFLRGHPALPDGLKKGDEAQGDDPAALAAARLRALTMVASRSAYNRDERARARFLSLLGDFTMWERTGEWRAVNLQASARDGAAVAQVERQQEKTGGQHGQGVPSIEREAAP